MLDPVRQRHHQVGAEEMTSQSAIGKPCTNLRSGTHPLLCTFLVSNLVSLIRTVRLFSEQTQLYMRNKGVEWNYFLAVSYSILQPTPTLSFSGGITDSVVRSAPKCLYASQFRFCTPVSYCRLLLAHLKRRRTGCRTTRVVDPYQVQYCT